MNTIKQRFENLKKKKKKGFTLIELVVVIAIMAILALIMVPNLTAYIAKGEVATVRANMKNVHTAAEMAYQLDEDGALDEDLLAEIAKYSNVKEGIQTAEPTKTGQYQVALEAGNTGRIVISAMTKDNTVHTFNGVKYTPDNSTPATPTP